MVLAPDHQQVIATKDQDPDANPWSPR